MLIIRWCLLSLILFAFLFPQPPKWELRGVWISAASGDWPKSTDPAEQQRSLIAILDNVRSNNLNTVFFQIRPRGNVLYRSVHEPWAQQLTGTLGKDPGYDPLAFAVEQAHKRGLEIHAWFNVAKVWGSEQLPSSPLHVTRTHRDWVKLYDGEWWLDMGNPAVRDYLRSLVRELADQYDVDGIHFDYVRYPGEKFDDWGSFSKWSDGAEKGEWRRNNITAFVRECAADVWSEKPWMKIGSAPLGIYQSIAGAQSSFTGYGGVYQDSRRWLREGICDYVAPQLYWSIGEQKNPNDPDFFALSNDWVQESYGRHVYIGIGAYRENVQSEIREQVLTTRAEGAQGQVFFRYENLAVVMLKLRPLYAYPALVPPMPWKDSTAPLQPVITAVQKENDRTIIRWTVPDSLSRAGSIARFVVYRSAQSTADTRRAENILAVLPSASRSYTDNIAVGKNYSYIVTAVDRAGNESGSVGSPVTGTASLFARYARPASEIRLSGITGDPSAGTVFFSYEIPVAGPVTLTLHTPADAETVLVRRTLPPGIHVAAIDTRTLPAGPFVYRLDAAGRSVTRTFEKK